MGHDGHDHDHDHGHHHHDHGHDHHHDTVAEHREDSPTTVSAFVVTCSDSRDEKLDEGGPLLRRLLEERGHTVTGALVVRDDVEAIRAAFEAGVASGARVVLFTGGTGLARRDVTVEAMTPLFDKTLPGFGELFRVLSFQEIGPAAMLSRAVAGVARGVLVFALPGSPRALSLALQRLVLPELGHLVREAVR